MMDSDFTSYAFQDLTLRKIKKYAAQYDGVDMTLLLGADDDNFPFLIHTVDDEYQLMIWNAYNGIMEHTDEDPVRAFATIQFLRDRAYPVLDSLDAADQWARQHDWPRKQRQTDDA
ncbi:MAG: hypothetical protein ACR2NU_08400 [Aeoliella sp.]